jgi:hypothetical protein
VYGGLLLVDDVWCLVDAESGNGRALLPHAAPLLTVSWLPLIPAVLPQVAKMRKYMAEETAKH